MYTSFVALAANVFLSTAVFSTSAESFREVDSKEVFEEERGK